MKRLGKSIELKHNNFSVLEKKLLIEKIYIWKEHIKEKNTNKLLLPQYKMY